jgi:hypothetical protein
LGDLAAGIYPIASLHYLPPEKPTLKADVGVRLDYSDISSKILKSGDAHHGIR